MNAAPIHSYKEYQSLLKFFHKRIFYMTAIPVSASNDTAKPATPTNPQQTQSNPPKPADKPSEQQK